MQPGPMHHPGIHRSFFNDLGKVFTYPLSGQGIAVIIIGGIIFGIARSIGSWVFVGILALCFGLIVSTLVAIYLFIYEFRIINFTANGEEDVPTWPSSALLESFFQLVGVYFVCFGPSVLCLLLALAIPWPPIAYVLVILSLPLFLVGAFYYPLTYMVTALFSSPVPALNLGFGFRSIGKIFPEYIIVVLFSFFFFAIPIGIAIAFWILGWIGQGSGVVINFAATLTMSFLGLYLRLANGFMLGRLYHTCEARLNWFPGTEEKVPQAIPQVYGGSGPAQAPAGGRDVAQGELPSRRSAPDLGTAKHIPTEDPFHAFREEKIAEKDEAAPGGEAWGQAFDKAKTPSKPPPVEVQDSGGGGSLAGRKDGFYSETGTREKKRGTGAYPIQPTPSAEVPRSDTGRYPKTGASASPGTGAFRQQSSGQNIGESPMTNTDENGGIPDPPLPVDDHSGPMRFSKEIQDLIDSGEFAEAKEKVDALREGARQRGNLAEITFYRKQIDIIEIMENA